MTTPMARPLQLRYSPFRFSEKNVIRTSLYGTVPLSSEQRVDYNREIRSSLTWPG
jgi:hypothetical protein